MKLTRKQFLTMAGAATLAAPDSLLKLLTVVLLFGAVTIVGLLLVPAYQTSK